jgi:hypothetical protein
MFHPGKRSSPCQSLPRMSLRSASASVGVSNAGPFLPPLLMRFRNASVNPGCEDSSRITCESMTVFAGIGASGTTYGLRPLHATVRPVSRNTRNAAHRRLLSLTRLFPTKNYHRESLSLTKSGDFLQFVTAGNTELLQGIQIRSESRRPHIFQSHIGFSVSLDDRFHGHIGCNHHSF